MVWVTENSSVCNAKPLHYKKITFELDCLVQAIGWLWVKDNCPLVGHETVGGVPSVEVFSKDPNPYLCVFRKKARKTPNG